MAVLQIREQLLPDVFILDCPHYSDTRGSLTKFFHSAGLEQLGIGFTAAESFLTRSSKGVLRGMHFQIGEAAHEKLVYCPRGRVLDVIVDIRPDSSGFNQPVSLELNESQPTVLFIGKGYAHGFLALEPDSWMLYVTSTMHEPALDRGVLWSSIHFKWPVSDPLISPRDLNHPPIELLL